MTAPEDDWRLTNQETYLKGAVLFFRQYRAPRADWDHDHCEFCFAKFMETPGPETLKEGYTTEDEYRWICPRCFHDFKERFCWVLASNSTVAADAAKGPPRG